MNPEVSVIIPAYNTEAYLAQAIESALGQTLQNIEVIVVDDASTDNTLEVAKSFNDKRLKVLANEQNLGAAAARNRALKTAQGKWIAVLDSDDWYATERLEKLVQIAYTNNADLIADDLYLIKDGEDTPWSTLIRQSGETINSIKQIDPVYFVETDIYGERGLHLGISKPLFRREFLIQKQINYDPNIRMGQDFWLVLTCLVRGARFFLVPKPYYFYRSRSGSLVYQSKVERLTQYCHKITDFMKKEEIGIKQTRLEQPLSKNFTVFKRNLSYYSVVEALKEKRWLTALKNMLNNPYFFLHFSLTMPQILNRRIQHYFLGNEAVYEMFSPRNKNPAKGLISAPKE